MLDRFERPLRMLCLALAAVLVFQFARLILRGDPLAHLNIPELPTLQATNQAGATNTALGTHATNTTKMTNATNTTNLTYTTNLANTTNATNSAAASTNTPSAASASPTLAGRPMGVPGMMGGGPPHVDLPSAIQNRVDKISDSEILGPVMRPQPVALIGIADDEAFIRAPSGQTGLIKVGGDLGGIKLLRIGMNRVLIEEDGEPKEITLFGGLGGESLMPATNAPALAPTNKTLSFKPKETP